MRNVEVVGVIPAKQTVVRTALSAFALIRTKLNQAKESNGEHAPQAVEASRVVARDPAALAREKAQAAPIPIPAALRGASAKHS